jgi:hypothetical protein
MRFGVVLAESGCVSGGAGGGEGVCEGAWDVWTRRVTRIQGEIIAMEARDVVVCFA